LKGTPKVPKLHLGDTDASEGYILGVLLINFYAYISLGGLFLVLFALRGIGQDVGTWKAYFRGSCIAVGVLIIMAGIWLNLRK
jgi:hypothetical protein